MILDSQNNIKQYQNDEWLSVQQSLVKEFGQTKYNSWFKNLELKSIDGSEVFLTVPSRFVCHWINNNCISKITSIWNRHNPIIFKVNIIVRKKDVESPQQPLEQKIASGVDVTGQNIDIINVANNNIGSPIDGRLSLNNFVKGESNLLAYAMAETFVKHNDQSLASFNTLYVYGEVGLGKTHLLHAIASKLKEQNPKQKIIYLSAERFMFEFVKSLREKSIMEFKNQIRSCDVLLIDDVQFICGKESTQEEFFHTCNYLLDMNKKLVIAGNKSPSCLDRMEQRLSSRLEGGLIADIKNADYDLRLDILKSKMEQMNNKNISNDVLEFIAVNISCNIRQLEGALNKVYAYSTIIEEKINIESVKKVLKDLLKSNDKAITIESIQKKVAGFYSIKVSDILSAKRTRNIARPRQIAMYLSKELTVKSLPEIGRKFGNKNHTTVMHAVKRIQELCLDDSELSKEVESLKASF